jgi:hypothetical protein
MPHNTDSWVQRMAAGRKTDGDDMRRMSRGCVCLGVAEKLPWYLAYLITGFVGKLLPNDEGGKVTSLAASVRVMTSCLVPLSLPL